MLVYSQDCKRTYRLNSKESAAILKQIDHNVPRPFVWLGKSKQGPLNSLELEIQGEADFLVRFTYDSTGENIQTVEIFCPEKRLRHLVPEGHILDGFGIKLEP